MTRIGLLSDTHSFLDDRILHHMENCDEIWHAGDFGSLAISQKLSETKPLKGVYGNIDGQDIRIVHPKELFFEIEGLKVYMTHIGGYPDHYNTSVKARIKSLMPNIFICGHSHILRIGTDKKFNNMLYINPGAAGKHGFHKIRTMVKFNLDNGLVKDMQVIELGKRA